VLSEVNNAADGDFDGTGESISDKTMCDDFAFCPILLCGEGEEYESGSVKIGFRALYWIDARPSTWSSTSARRKGVSSEVVPMYSPG
jgi:hypothetical protein